MNQPSLTPLQPMPGEYSGYLKENLNPTENLTNPETAQPSEETILRQERAGARAAALAAVDGATSVSDVAPQTVTISEEAIPSDQDVTRVMTDAADRLEQLRMQEGQKDLRALQNGDYGLAA